MARIRKGCRLRPMERRRVIRRQQRQVLTLWNFTILKRARKRKPNASKQLTTMQTEHSTRGRRPTGKASPSGQSRKRQVAVIMRLWLLRLMLRLQACKLYG